MRDQLTVKFISTDKEKFKEFAAQMIGLVGEKGGLQDGVYVEMVSACDIEKQINDISEAIQTNEDDEIILMKIDSILAGD